MTQPAAQPATPSSRNTRRRARTRARLLDAARRAFAEKGVAGTRIAEITEEADVAAGSFYNHFADKDAIVRAVLLELAEEQGATVDRLTRDMDDPAAAVAFAHRYFVRLATSDPTFARLVIRLDASHALMREVLGPRAIHDIHRGVRAGRFEVEDSASYAYASGGALVGTIAGVVAGALRAGADEVHAAAVLRMLGLDVEAAATVAALPMD